MLVGKWHCGDQPEFLPTRHGFDHYYGLPYSNDMGRQAGRNEREGYPPLPLMLDEEVIQEQPDQASRQNVMWSSVYALLERIRILRFSCISLICMFTFLYMRPSDF